MMRNIRLTQSFTFVGKLILFFNQKLEFHEKKIGWAIHNKKLLKIKKKSQNWKVRKKFHPNSNLSLPVVCFAVTLLLTSSQPVEADDVPAFFLKIAKNIPRVGRSGRFEDYFLKAAKNIPRIGKRPDGEEVIEFYFILFFS